jgi:hypothetical protein
MRNKQRINPLNDQAVKEVFGLVSQFYYVVREITIYLSCDYKDLK